LKEISATAKTPVLLTHEEFAYHTRGASFNEFADDESDRYHVIGPVKPKEAVAESTSRVSMLYLFQQLRASSTPEEFEPHLTAEIREKLRWKLRIKFFDQIRLRLVIAADTTRTDLLAP